MKVAVIIAVFMLIAASAFGQIVYVSVDVENLRDAPQGNIIAKVFKGQDFVVLKQQDDWSRVISADHEGWIWTASTTRAKDDSGESEDKAVMPEYEVVGERDVSHGAARRITYFVRLSSGCSRDQIRKVIEQVTTDHIPYADIIWLNIVPENAKPPNDYTWEWLPIMCSTKWIRSGLDPQWHTPESEYENPDEWYKTIAVNWNELVMKMIKD